jgi:hypothetical protein
LSGTTTFPEHPRRQSRHWKRTAGGEQDANRLAAASAFDLAGHVQGTDEQFGPFERSLVIDDEFPSRMARQLLDNRPVDAHASPLS